MFQGQEGGERPGSVSPSPGLQPGVFLSETTCSVVISELKLFTPLGDLETVSLQIGDRLDLQKVAQAGLEVATTLNTVLSLHPDPLADGISLTDQRCLSTHVQ